MSPTFFPSLHRHQCMVLAIVLPSLVMPLSSFGQEEEKSAGDIIQIDRPMTVGSAFYEKTTLKYSNDILAMDENSEKFIENPTATIAFEADQLIVATTPSGYARELMMRIDKLTSLKANEDSVPETLIKPGTYVHAVAAEIGCTFSIDGKELENEEASQILDDLIGLLKEDPPIAREEMLLIGKKHPRKAGERWFLDRASLAKIMSSDEQELTPNDVSGSAMYQGKFNARGIECQRFTYNYSVQITSVDELIPRRNFRSLTVNLPIDTSQMERSFELRRWTRIDQKFNNRDMIFQGVRSMVYLLDYYTEIDLITDEDVLAKLREAHESHQTKAAEQKKQKKEDQEDEAESKDPTDQPNPANSDKN